MSSCIEKLPHSCGSSDGLQVFKDDALLHQVLEALSACDIYAYAGGEGLMSTKHTAALKAIRTRLGLLK